MASTGNSFRGLDLVTSFIASEKLPYHIVLFLAFLLLAFYATGTRPKFPVLNPQTTTAEFMRKSKDLFVTGRSTFGIRPYIMRTYLGNAIVLPPQMMEEVRNLNELDFWAAIEVVRLLFLLSFYPLTVVLTAIVQQRTTMGIFVASRLSKPIMKVPL